MVYKHNQTKLDIDPIWQLIFINRNSKKSKKMNRNQTVIQNEHSQIEALEGSTGLTAQLVDINVKLVISRLK